MSEPNKNIDESWKEQVDKEKGEAKDKQAFTPPEVDFKFFATTLAIQASMALGQIPNPASNKAEVDLGQARFLIDTLGMLKEKTKGNLTPEEERLLENFLYDLRMIYLSHSQEGGTKP
jgi:hypothetical protein